VFKTKEPKLDKRTLKHDRVESRKIEWPTKEFLIELLKNMSYVSIGKKYGVSDNAVRKWSKKYEII
jgi:transposase-like protein